MSAQTNYSYSTPKGVPGGKYDISDDIVNSRTNDEADGNMKFGLAVAVGSTPGASVKVPVAGTTKEKIEGVTLHAENTEQDMNGKVVIKNGATLGVMTKGHVWGRTGEGAEPTYRDKAYVIVDGEDAGCFTHRSEAYTRYEQCESGTAGAKQIIANEESVSGQQIKLESVTPVAPGYTPVVGDYVVSKQHHGATVDIGAVFGNASDDGIAVIEL